MKNILFTMMLVTFGSFIQAQPELVLRFDHRLDGKVFALNQEVISPMGTKYKLTRLQYYISGLKITHDGGQELILRDVYLFVDPSKPSSKEFSLGVHHDITYIDSIEFAIGVDSSSNHLDPASYSATHPLAPKNPTMHWGWTAGYRFISLSGNAARANGSFIDLINIEGLGDINFKTKTYPVQSKLENGKIYMDMKAEYNKLLENIVIVGGANNHGETGSAAVLLANASQMVFNGVQTASQDVYENTLSEVVYSSGGVFINHTFPFNTNLQFYLYDSKGIVIQLSKVNTNEGTIVIDNQLIAGNYFYAFIEGNKTVSTGKIVKR
ncbi:MAG: T9SS type A sorting domain-containing protein [Bacteroidota bacterium]|nr:T9SS type A sorting domain-containing protein [Bacteroidota bacterium]